MTRLAPTCRHPASAKVLLIESKIDAPRKDDQPRRVDFFNASLRLDLANRDDPIALNQQIPVRPGVTRAIDDLPAANNQPVVRIDRLRSDSELSSADGVSGDPRRATVELGQIGVALIVSRTVEAIKKAVERR